MFKWQDKQDCQSVYHWHLAKDKTWHPISTRTWLHAAFLCCILHLLSLPAQEANRYYHQYLNTLDLLQCLMLMKLKCFCFWSLLFKWDMTYATAWWTTSKKIEQSLFLFAAKVWNVTVCFTLFNFQSKLWKTTKSRKCFWLFEWHLLKILHPFWTSGCGQSFHTFQRKGNFQTIDPQETQHFVTKIYNLYDKTDCTFNMDTYLGKDRMQALGDTTATHEKLKCLTEVVEGQRYRI